MEPPPLPATPGQGPASAQCPGDAASRAAALEHSQPGSHQPAGSPLPCAARQQSISMLTATPNIFKGHNSSLLKH